MRDLTRTAYARWVPVIGREPKPMTADYERAVIEHRIDLGAIDGELVGLVEMIEQPDHLLIENVAVAPDRQGQGIGRALVDHAEATAGQLGYDTVRLYTNQRFASNVRLYRALGYAVDREERLSHGVAVHMSKAIPSTGAGSGR